MAAFSIPSLCQRHQEWAQGSSPSELSSLRSQFLAGCGKYYESIHPGKKSYLPDDAFLKKAEEIVADKIFQDHPGSLFRLKPLATRFVQQLNGTSLLFSISNQPSAPVVNEQIGRLVSANIQFIEQFIAEFKIVGKHTALGTQYNQPQALKVYYSTVFDYLITNPAHVPAAQTMFDDADSKLFDLIPYCVALTLMKHPLPADQLPELFAPSESELSGLRERFSKLPLSDQKALYTVPFNEEPSSSDENPLTPAGQEFYRSLFELIYAKREHEKPVFAAINQALFEFVSLDLQLAQSLQSHPKIKDVPMPAEIDGIVAFLKELSEPEYLEIKKAFSFLPAHHDLAHFSSAQIEGRTYIYRLQGIVMLGHALAQSCV
ncbi:MAG: hypothetical protein JSR39_05980 [Verrucomicrobia bacterium]|nr:hypothetical protein [Verrucomicrobiota bacterium]